MNAALLLGGGLIAYLLLRKPASQVISPMAANPLVGGASPQSGAFLSGLEAFTTAALGVRPVSTSIENPILSQQSIDSSLAFQPDLGPAYLVPSSPDVESDLSASESTPDLSYLGGLDTGADLTAPTE